MEKTVKHFCTTANRVKEDVVEFVKNIDWKKVAVGVGVTMAFTGVVLLSGGSAAPVLLSAAIGSGSGAVFNGVFTAMNGGSIADIAESASDGFMWGAIGGSFGGGTTVLLSESAAAGSSLMGNPFFQRLVQGAADTAVDTAQSASKGLPVTPEGVLINMTYNTLMAGGIGSGGKQAVNEAVDETADSIGDSVRREVKSGSASATEMAKPQGGCFTGETLIPTAKGEKAIREIRVGDLVLSENPETGERGYKEVRRLYLHESSRLIHVFVGNEEIKATPEHPFWVEGKGFVTADALRAGDEVRLCDGSRTNVEKTEEEVLEEPVQVYNFEVADWHTYYVSGTGVLVHNSCGVNGGSTTQGVGNPVKVEGRGNTGRTTPNTLSEQMAMHQVQSNPLENSTKVPLEMTDSRWSASEGWVKMQSVVQNADKTKTTIHYVYNEITGTFDDFKFK